MARIIGGIGASHSPTIGFAKDNKTSDDQNWRDVFKVFEPVTNWLEKENPDVLFLIYNDHVTSFFFDHYSPFVLGIDDQYITADEGGGPREYPPVKGHAKLARHIAHSLFADEFDISFFQHKPVDHGLFSPLSMMTERGKSWDGSIVPLQIGVLQHPIPTARRCFRLGQSLKQAIESFPENLSVAVVATGGLSHQVHGERAGFNDLKWDHQFLDLLEKQPEVLSALTHTQYAELGGMEGSEVIMWLVMRGALSPSVNCIHRDLCLPSMTTIATVIFENKVPSELAGIKQHQKHVKHQLNGIENIEGTYPFTLEVSHRAFRLNNFFHQLINPSHRKRFIENPGGLYDEFSLTKEERELIDSRNWIGLIHYGVIFHSLEKMAAVLGMSNPDVYAQMRGDTMEEFLNSRNVKLKYSVAGVGGKMNFTDDS